MSGEALRNDVKQLFSRLFLALNIASPVLNSSADSSEHTQMRHMQTSCGNYKGILGERESLFLSLEPSKALFKGLKGFITVITAI
jgi:hypothetical protein